jgi:hypothetical protein
MTITIAPGVIANPMRQSVMRGEREVFLSAQQFQIVLLTARARSGITPQRLFDCLFAHLPDGGPVACAAWNHRRDQRPRSRGRRLRNSHYGTRAMTTTSKISVAMRMRPLPVCYERHRLRLPARKRRAFEIW